MKNSPPIAKKHKENLIYINVAQPHQKTMEIFTRYSNTQNFMASHTGLWKTVGKIDDLEKYLNNDIVIYDGAIKSP